jgi:cytochrome c-type biogenesis protein CcmH/NrfG
VERRQLARGDQALRAGPDGGCDRGLIRGRALGLARTAAPAFITFAAIVGLAAANGGYFPTDYGWAALGFLVLAATAVLLVERVELGRLDWALLAGLAGLTLWVGLSAAWSTSLAQPLLEAERTVVYPAAALALLLVVRREGATSLLAGVAAGSTAVGAYALATRLFPDALGAYDPTGTGYQLAEPVGYSNALGILVAIGILLAMGFAAEAPPAAARALASASLVVLGPALYFTFSRGAWLALIVGAAVLVALQPRRLRSSVVALLAAVPAGLAVLACSRTEALTHVGAPLPEAARAGHRLAGVLAAILLGSALLGLALPRVEGRLVLPRRLQLSFVVAAAVGLAAGVALIAVSRGPSSSGDLNERLVNSSSSFRTDYWRVARSQFADHPWLGAGAGSFERFWLERRPIDFFSRDAHSLYAETLAELGPIGLLLVVGTLSVPLVAARGVRARRYAAAAAGAYVAFLAHAGIDWDWEMPVVTVAGLACGVALVILGRRTERPRPASARFRIGALVLLAPLTAWVLLMHVGNAALLASSEALGEGDLEQAEAQARKAQDWAPWSYEPWQRLGEAELAQGDAAAARSSFGRAIERDPANWELWYDLALASEGDERGRSLDEAVRLNPLSTEVRQLRAASS